MECAGLAIPALWVRMAMLKCVRRGKESQVKNAHLAYTRRQSVASTHWPDSRCLRTRFAAVQMIPILGSDVTLLRKDVNRLKNKGVAALQCNCRGGGVRSTLRASDWHKL